MSKFINPLSNVRIASPCSRDWNEMIGTERKRFCGECKLNVYNLSGMTRREAENLLLNSEGRLCVRFYRRADGSVLTKDCPVGWQALKQRVSRAATAFASLVFAACGGIGLVNYFAKANQEPSTIEVTTSDFENPTTGEINYQEPVSTIAVQGAPTLMMGKPVIGSDEFFHGPEGKAPDFDRTKKRVLNRRDR